MERLRDAAEEIRVHPGSADALTVRLDDGTSLTGVPVAVEDREVYLQVALELEPTAVPLEAVCALEVGLP
ncbi:hypothetical protein ACFQ46_22275 [Kineococcus sp. GCM10028916]|uniref:hypothetical protein n=1 Tax=Kineococcus sp. GCM10028916 TaxID=3273394 RepID=UPI003643AEC8